MPLKYYHVETLAGDQWSVVFSDYSRSSCEEEARFMRESGHYKRGAVRVVRALYAPAPPLPMPSTHNKRVMGIKYSPSTPPPRKQGAVTGRIQLSGGMRIINIDREGECEVES